MDTELEMWRRCDPKLRRQVLEVRSWAMAQGRPVDADALTVIFAVLAAEEARRGVDPTLWTADRTLEFVFGVCHLWCAAAEISVPPTTAEALWTWFTMLDTTGGFAENSDALRELQAVLVGCAGLDRQGRSVVAQRRTVRAG